MPVAVFGGLYTCTVRPCSASVNTRAHSVIIRSVRGVPAKRPTFKLMGSAEISRRLGGLSRTRIYQLTQRRGFPAPYAKLDMGYVWLADDVEAWIAENRQDIAQGVEEA